MTMHNAIYYNKKYIVEINVTSFNITKYQTFIFFFNVIEFFLIL